jgi:Tfp pilus assembly protein PilO
MKQRMFAALARLDPRMLLALVILIAGLAALEGWLLLLRKPLAEYQKLVATRESLGLSLAAAPNQRGELGRLAAELLQVSARLSGLLRPAGPNDQLASLVMAELDRSAGQNGITLAGIRPGARREVLGFEEISFDVNAQGSYLRLCQWLVDFERTLGQSATVSEFTMKAAGEGREIALTLKVGLYRPLQLAGAAK